VFLFAEEFEWKDKSHKFNFNNQPAQGRAYIAVLESASGFYRLYLPGGDGQRERGLMLDELVLDSDRWKCKFSVMSTSNLCEMKLHRDDIKMISDEIRTGSITGDDINGSARETNLDTLDTLADDSSLEPPVELELGTEESQEVYPILLALGGLREADYQAYTTLLGLIQYLGAKFSDIDPNTFLDNMLLDSDAIGKKGVLALALSSIQDYSLADEDEQPRKLIDAIYYLTAEIIRYKIKKHG
jgi:hypothetical protein